MCASGVAGTRPEMHGNRTDGLVEGICNGGGRRWCGGWLGIQRQRYWGCGRNGGQTHPGEQFGVPPLSTRHDAGSGVSLSVCREEPAVRGRRCGHAIFAVAPELSGEERRPRCTKDSRGERGLQLQLSGAFVAGGSPMGGLARSGVGRGAFGRRLEAAVPSLSTRGGGVGGVARSEGGISSSKLGLQQWEGLGRSLSKIGTMGKLSRQRHGPQILLVGVLAWPLERMGAYY